jgi:hypothetical protein
VSTSAYRYQGRFTFHASADEVREVVTPTAGRIEPVDEHSCIAHFGSNSLEELGVWVALLGFDFDIHEPPELAEALVPVAARLTRATTHPRPRS